MPIIHLWLTFPMIFLRQYDNVTYFVTKAVQEYFRSADNSPLFPSPHVEIDRQRSEVAVNLGSPSVSNSMWSELNNMQQNHLLLLEFVLHKMCPVNMAGDDPIMEKVRTSLAPPYNGQVHFHNRNADYIRP